MSIKHILQNSALGAAIVATLIACATPVPQALEPRHIPANFTSPTAQGAPIWPSADWWAGFGSSELNNLVATAHANNLDLAAAAARVLQAQAQSKISGGTLFPSIGLSGSADRARSAQSGRTSINNSFGLSLDASYQVDLWGRARDNLRAADQLVMASRYAQQVVALSITAGVANTYWDVLVLRERIAIAKQNAETARRILDIVQARVKNGATSRLDLAQQETLLQAIEAAIPPLEEQEREALLALAILLGRLPEGFDVQGSPVDRIMAPAVAPGLPSDLLRRRPDVAQTEANLASAHANVDAARAAFFPQIGLTGSGGFASAALSNLFTGSGIVWTIGSSLAQTLFGGGTLKGQLELNKARQQELVAAYQSAVLNAFSDVEKALSQVSSLALQERLKTAQEKSAAEAFRISELQYRQGETDLLSVLTTQQTLFTAQDQLVQIKLARLQADVGLFQALGGGWSESPVLATQGLPARTTVVEAGPATAVPPGSGRKRSGLP